MSRSEEAEWWANAVYSAIQEIPPAESRHTATLRVCWVNRARQVGVVLKSLPSPDSGSHFTSENVPWQRVINARGMISHRGPGSAQRHADVLQQENVEATADSMGEWYVDFSRYGWFPSSLPSENVPGDNP
ncbi:hypothetical protein N7474_002219 [Penicillium riverlandense]|uniref:uncharacterized protein n=1 Tax=Penicillium riverlandense TaxID=1903569 RepID=UPI00254921BC|nr:uncharacterized protein N7474_002219 [Penicillium riverlandense]KAJ5833908.1 hypothetical protein N7474_002219 [Penicillium riverlandense]